MEKIPVKNILLILLSLVIIWLLLQIPSCKDRKKQYWENKNFKTKIIRVPVPYKSLVPFKVQIPPHTIIQYLPNPISNVVVCEKDSLIKVIDSLGKELARINKNYLTQYPRSPKLVGGLFSLDTIRLDLLNTNGKITTNLYPSDFNNFRYQWLDSSMRVEPLSQIQKETTKPQERLTHNFYVSPGYNFINMKPFISADYYIRYKRFQLAVEPKVTIEQIPNLELNAKIGIRIR